ncbi:uncharacterized protein LOC127252918 [Andrographis paniculata]|uniref:uncharacterized protein LOC127252918 n=1 Tax=Andrographis paniculata TaxID=175694 RepID=UPI0021E853C6|nr:uncharacterized protein LOC127252918 [Andrographis paniculata]
MAATFEFMDVVKGTTTALAKTVRNDAGEEVPNPLYSAWFLQEQKLLGVLYATLKPEAMAEVLDCRSFRSAWLALESAFASRRSVINSLRQRPLDEGEKRHWFLHGLGHVFFNFADTRMSMNPIPPFRDLLHQEMQFELMQKSMEGANAPSVAFAASYEPSGGHGSNQPRHRDHWPRYLELQRAASRPVGYNNQTEAAHLA